MRSREPKEVAPRPGRRRRTTWRRRICALALGGVLSLGLVEIFVRCYAPFDLRVRGGRIMLPVNRRLVIENDEIERVDREIIHVRNGIGFRGPEPPTELEEHFAVVTVGGSTTECFYLTEGRTWTDRLGARLEETFDKVWVNNAGLDGHSTHGHLALVSGYLGALRPKVALFLIGLNDLGRARAGFNDRSLDRKTEGRGIVTRLWAGLTRHSAAAALVDNWRRHRAAQAAGLVHHDLNHDQLRLASSRAKLPSQERDRLLSEHDAYLAGFRERVTRLIELCRDAGIEPVLVTQPSLYGPAIDDVTGVDLATVRIGESDGATDWQILEKYNDVTRAVGKATGVTVIELARKMPKSSRLYYDYTHFTNPGAEQVASIIADQLTPELKRRFPKFVK